MTLQLLEQEYHQLLERIRSCLIIDGQPTLSHPLLGGMSGATIARLTMNWQPTAEVLSHLRHTEVSSVGSTIIKIEETTALCRAANAFAQIPEEYQPCFARIIDGPHRFQQGRMAYLLIEDLAGYMTLHDALAHGPPPSLRAIPEQLIVFLQKIYTMPSCAKQQVTWENLYFQRIDRALTTLQQWQGYLVDFDSAYTAIKKQLALLRQQCIFYKHVPQSVMHGDLHLRNIMLREVRPEVGDIDFRLIDIDKFQRTGDLAMDLGQLLTDIEQMRTTTSNPEAAWRLGETLETVFCRDAAARQDSSFTMRLALAKARASLKLIKLQIKHLLANLQLPQAAPPTQAPPIRIQANFTEVQQHLNVALAQCP